MKRKKIISTLLIALLISGTLSGCSKPAVLINRNEDKTGIEQEGNNPEEQNLIKDQETEIDEKDVTDEAGIIVVGDKKPAQDSVNQGITVNQIKYEVVDVSNLPEQLAEEIETLKLSQGYAYWLQEDGSYYILISAGEKSTGGYDIKVEAIEDNEGKTIISVIESESTDDMVAQVISYPVVIVKAAGITDQFIVRDQNQKEYSLLTLEADAASGGNAAGQTTLRLSDSAIDYSKPFTGIYQGLVDARTFEVLVGDTHTFFSSDNISQYLEGIGLGDAVELVVELSPSDQLILKSVTKVQND